VGEAGEEGGGEAGAAEAERVVEVEVESAAVVDKARHSKHHNLAPAAEAGMAAALLAF
jgi:hypothetical protein